MPRPAVPGRLLIYYTSLDVTGDYEHSVSYASIAFPRLATAA
jgi:AmmeMemoRadiSam system protein B